MASAASDRGRPPGRTALAGKAPRTTDAPDGARPGLVISELAHLGKLNLRGGDGIVPAVRKHTGCDRLPGNNRTVTVGDRTLVWLAPDEYLLLCEAGREGHLHSQLMLDLGKVHAD